MASKSSRMGKSVKLLVANKHVMEAQKLWNKLEYPILSGTEGVFFIDDEDDFNQCKTKLAFICKKPISRIYYIDGDNDEVPIDCELEYKEAMKFIREHTNKWKFTTLKIETTSGKNYKKKTAQKAISETAIAKKLMTKLRVDEGERSVADKLRANGESEPVKSAAEAKKSSDKVLAEHTSCVNGTPGSGRHPVRSFGFTRPIGRSNPFRLTRPLLNLESLRNTMMEDIDAQKAESNHSWIEPHLNRMKQEIMGDVEAMMKPYIEEQKKLRALIAALHLEDRVVPSGTLEMHAELDHIDSASSRIVSTSSSLEKSDDSEDIDPKIYEDVHLIISGGPDFTMTKCDSDFDLDFDENLSILSGEISVTDSESDVDEGRSDFVDVPLPSCFNLISAQGTFLKKSEKEGKLAKTSGKGKGSKNSKSEAFMRNQGKTVPKSTLRSSAGLPGNTSSFDKKSSTAKIPTITRMTLKKNRSKQHSNVFFQMGMDYSKAKCKQNEKFQLNGSGGDTSGSHSKYDGYNGVQESINGTSNQSGCGFDEYIDTDAKDMPNTLSGAYQGHSWLNSLHQEAQGIQNDAVRLTGLLSSLCEQQISSPSALGATQQPTATSISKVLYQQGWLKSLASRQRLLALIEMQAANMYGRRPPQILKSTVQPPTMKPLELTPNGLVLQHQEVVQAATRLAEYSHDIQTHFLSTAPYQAQQYGSDVAPRKSEESNDNAIHFTPEEVRVWNGVEAVDTELRKWVQMFQKMMDSVPRGVNESPPSTQEELKKMLDVAFGIHSELEFVYESFHHKLSEVSKYMRAHKEKAQQQQDAGKPQPFTEDPILILPDKVMNIISSTLNSTFNILGKISGSGVLNYCSSNQSESNTSTQPMEKPQPQKPKISYPPQNFSLGHQPKENTSCCIANHDHPITFCARTLPLPPVASTTYPMLMQVPNNPYTPVSAHTLPQPQQLHIPVQLPRQVTVQPSMQRPIATLSQHTLHAPIPHQTMQAPIPHQTLPMSRSDASGRQIVENRVDNIFSGLPIHAITTPVYFSTLKPGPGGMGKHYGGYKN